MPEMMNAGANGLTGFLNEDRFSRPREDLLASLSALDPSSRQRPLRGHGNRDTGLARRGKTRGRLRSYVEQFSLMPAEAATKFSPVARRAVLLTTRAVRRSPRRARRSALLAPRLRRSSTAPCVHSIVPRLGRSRPRTGYGFAGDRNSSCRGIRDYHGSTDSGARMPKRNPRRFMPVPYLKKA